MCSEPPVIPTGSEADFRTDRQTGMQIDTRLDFIDMNITQRVLIGPQTDELMGYCHMINRY